MTRLVSKRFLFLCGYVSGNYLSVVYLIIKLFYILNALGQIFLLNLFLGTDYHMFGIQVSQCTIQHVSLKGYPYV